MECFSSPCSSLSTGAVNQYLSLLFNYLSIAQCSLSPPELWPRDYGDIAIRKGLQEYDFIVVGAGSAGSVVANRLSENPHVNVLVLEAGGDPPIESTIPALMGTIMSSSKYNWQYPVEPSDRYSLYTTNGGIWAKGKMLGGSSSINSMAYVRGNERDYNNWEALGNPTWGWSNVLQYFKKSEANQNSEIADAFGGYYHSKDGLLSVELDKSNDTITSTIIQAAQEMGFKILLDINANEHIGFTSCQGTVRSGERASTAAAFLIPAKSRANLHIVKYAHVLDLIIDGNGVVSGVRMNIRGQKELKVYAKREVILSAGAVGSPQILMLSGIGPSRHLQEMNIPVIRDLKVGQNLQDHPMILFFLRFRKPIGKPLLEKDFLQSFVQYLIERTGSLAAVGIGQVMGFVNVFNASDKYSDIQYIHVFFKQGQVNEIKGFCNDFGYSDQLIQTLAKEVESSDILVLLTLYLRPKSKAELFLRSAEPTEKPRIISNYLTEDSDIEAFIKAIQLYIKFLQAPSYAAYQGQLLIIPIPECDALNFNSHDYWSCYCRYIVASGFHAVGSVKMGPDSDPDSVVDYRLRVKGTKNLRVIDASIMPIIPSGNTNAPTIMIGEKGADFVKEDNSLIV